MRLLQETDEIRPGLLKEPMRGAPGRWLLCDLGGSVKESTLLLFRLREGQEAGKWVHCAISSGWSIKRNNKKLK
jgi:hypothetical protein